MNDVNFPDNNLLNIFQLITKIAEFGQLEESRSTSSSLNRERKASARSL